MLTSWCALVLNILFLIALSFVHAMVSQGLEYLAIMILFSEIIHMVLQTQSGAHASISTYHILHHVSLDF